MLLLVSTILAFGAIAFILQARTLDDLMHSTTVSKLLEYSQRIDRQKETAELIRKISSASHEQSAGANEIAKAIGQMDQAVQRNAVSAETLTPTSTSLAEQANGLVKSIAVFRLG